MAPFRLLPVAGLLLLLPLIVAACAVSGNDPGGSSNVLTEEQLRDANLESYSAMGAIQRLRPAWLRSRTSTMSGGQVYPAVYVDGRLFGAVHELNSIGVSEVREIRYVSARDATTRYGTGHVGGVISISTRHR